MSGFEMYLLMKLDTIRCIVVVPSSIILFAAVFAGISCYLFIDEKGKQDYTKVGHRLMALAAVCFIFMSAGRMIPTTKEAAVLFVAPKIVNSEFVQEDLPEEAKELYGLAKQYLKEQVEKESK